MVINKFSEVPIYEQLIREMEREILCGFLKEEEQVPSIRELSASVGVNPNTIQKAYLELARREEIVASPGNGYFVAPGALARVHQREVEKLREISILALELKRAGVSVDDVLETVRKAYDEKGDNHD